MIDKYRDKLDEKGVPPVIGVILLVAVTVALVALATVIVFDIGSDVSDTADASVQMEQTDSGVKANIVHNVNVEEFILKHEDGTEQRSTKSLGSFTYDNGYGEYTLIAVVGGNEEVIRSTTVVGAESGETLSGTVEINPLIVGATVEAYDAGGTLVDSTTTDANGQYELTVADASSARIVLNTEGDITYNGEPLHASAEQSGFSAGDTVNFNFDENTATSGISVNGESVTVVSALEGESSSVIEVGNLAQLQAMQGDLSADYKLIRNIDASETENWNEKTSDEFKTSLSNGDTTELNYVASESTINVVNESGVDVTFTTNAGNDSITIDDTYYDSNPEEFTISYDLATPFNQGFNPIGDNDVINGVSFTGSFDGQNQTISNLSINRLDYVGLFGHIDSSAEVENIGILYADINSYKSFVGSLVGTNEGTVSNSYSTGNVSGDNRVGGLVGRNYGTVSNSYSTGNVSGEVEVSGLVGRNYGTVSNSYSTGNVSGESYVGGLIGYNYDSTVSNSYSTGNVSGESYVGGLVGETFNGNISNSYSTGNVSGEVEVSGLVGENFNGNISNSYSTGNVSGEEKVGGLVGENDNGTVSNSYSTGNVTGELYYVGDNRVGGLIGYNRDGTVSNSYATGSVSGVNYVGGLVGENYKSNISNSYSTGNVTGELYYVGGLVGRNYNNGTVSNSYSTGNVTGEDEVGGLVGINSNSNISNSYSTGNVTGEFNVSGLVGMNSIGTVSNSYSTGNVSGYYMVGGLVGYNLDGGTVSNSYSTGNVTGELRYVGGLVGKNYNSTVSNSYWNSDSKITENSKDVSTEDSTDLSTDNTKSAVPLTTSQMQGCSASSSMSGFDFTDTWSTVEGDYPELQVSQSKQMQTLFVLSC